MRVSYYADKTGRAKLISGLHALAEFLKNHENVPAPIWADVMVFPAHASDDDEQRREIDRIAALIETRPTESISGHYTAARRFGTVEYRAIAIPRTDAGEA